MMRFMMENGWLVGINWCDVHSVVGFGAHFKQTVSGKGSNMADNEPVAHHAGHTGAIMRWEIAYGRL